MKYALINGIILNGKKDMKPVKDKVILVDGEKIEDIVSKDKSLEGYKIVDLKGKYIMPGLINLHVHLPVAGNAEKPRSKPKDYKKLFKLLTDVKLVQTIFLKSEEKYVRNELYSGVTTLRAVGGLMNFDSRIRDKINAGKIPGPRLLVANSAISVPNGHFAGSLAVIANSPEEAREYVRKFSKDKPDLVKLMITGGVMDSDKEGEPGALRMDGKIVKAACEEAHKLGLPVAAHIECSKGVKVALENGVDTIEHGAVLDDYLISKFKETGAAVVTTLSPVVPYVFFDLKESNCLPVAKANAKIVMDGILDACNKALENGIKVGLGTDTGCPFISHYDMWRELYYFTKYIKVSNSFALYSATLGNAEILHREKEIGSIEKGKSADMIVCASNPLEDLTVLRNLDKVIFKGKVINNPKIKKDKKIQVLLDKYM